MEKIFTELERKVERVASAIKRLKEENSKLRLSNQELNQRLRELKATESGSDGTHRELKSRIAQLENERDSLVELRKRVETRLEAILSQFEWLDG
jgi:regulator of replication initiation timing